MPRTMSRKSEQCIATVAVIGVAGLAPTAVEAQTGPDLDPYAIVVTTNPGGTGPGGNVGPSVGVRNDGDESSAATREEDGATAEQSAYVRVEVPDPGPDAPVPTPALSLLG